MTIVPSATGSKPEPASERERWLDRHAVDGHLKVAARNAVAVNVALH